MVKGHKKRNRLDLGKKGVKINIFFRSLLHTVMFIRLLTIGFVIVDYISSPDKANKILKSTLLHFESSTVLVYLLVLLNLFWDMAASIPLLAFHLIVYAITLLLCEIRFSHGNKHTASTKSGNLTRTHQSKLRKTNFWLSISIARVLSLPLYAVVQWACSRNFKAISFSTGNMLESIKCQLFIRWAI